MAEAAFIEKES